MKKFYLLTLFLISSVVFYSILRTNHSVTPKLLQSQTPVVASPSSINLVDRPISISIPKLNISTKVESVGMDSQGKMDVPSNDTDVAWYNLGFKPGEKGSAVIDGHFDTTTGAPAVFYYLSNLKAGDQITVNDQQNHIYTFKVTEVKGYNFNDLPLQTIFDSTDKPRLNLITCEGVWDPNTKNYSQRLVVYSEMN